MVTKRLAGEDRQTAAPPRSAARWRNRHVLQRNEAFEYTDPLSHSIMVVESRPNLGYLSAARYSGTQRALAPSAARDSPSAKLCASTCGVFRTRSPCEVRSSTRI